MIRRFASLRAVSTAVALSAAFVVPQVALAHALLVSSSPHQAEVVHGDHAHIELKFNSRVDGGRSSVMLVSKGGPSHALKLDTQPAPEVLSTDATDLHKGAYSLRWQAVASDGHISRGEIAFSVQ